VEYENTLMLRDRDGTAEGGARKNVLQKIFECKKAERSGKSLGETARSRRYSRRLKFNWRRNDMILSDEEPHCQELSTMRSDPKVGREAASDIKKYSTGVAMSIFSARMLSG